MSERVCAVCAADGATVCSCDKPMTSPAIPSPKGEMLKRCPFCGSEKSLDLDFVEYASDDRRIYCADCSAEGPRGESDASAIAAWNRRSSSSREEVRREALEEAAKVAEQLAGTLMHLQPTINPLVQIGSHLETCRVIATAIRSLSQGE